MAIISQPSLFSWPEIDELGDLERLRLLLTHLPDEPLVQALEARRGSRGRNDYPIRLKGEHRGRSALRASMATPRSSRSGHAGPISHHFV